MATYHIHQKITPFANQYKIYGDNNGQPGNLLAFAHQKRLALKEKFIFYTDESKQQVVFTMQARQVLELAGTYDVRAADETLLGTLQKQFKQSLLRSTWTVRQPDRTEDFLVVRERSAGLAAFRRVWQILPILGDIPFLWKYHFDFFDPVLNTTPATYEKVTLLRDHYQLQASAELLENIDWRVLVAQGVALDALQSR